MEEANLVDLLKSGYFVHSKLDPTKLVRWDVYHTTSFLFPSILYTCTHEYGVQ